MSLFNFEPVQFLDIKAEDNPKIDVKDGMLLIKANRGNDRIVISAPLESVLPTASITQATVRRPQKPRRVQQRRPPAIKPGTILPATHGSVGENNVLAKLTEDSVREMRAVAKDPDYVNAFKSRQAMIQDLAQVYKIHWTTVYNILNRKSWKHLSD